MSRPLRIEYPGAWYHVMNRGRRREKIFLSEEDYSRFLQVLHEASSEWSLRVSAYCLMGNHYHLLVQTPHGNLARCMRHINGVYTQRFNKAHGIDGQLFRGRYKAVLVEEDSHLLEVLRYIHRNPLQAGIVKRLDEFKWSSHAGYLSQEKQWEWLHKDFLQSMISTKKSRRNSAYLDFVSKGNSAEIERFYALKNLPSILAGDGFKEWLKETIGSLGINREIPESRELYSPSPGLVMSCVCNYYNLSQEELVYSRRGITNQPRDLAIYLVRYHCRQSLAEVGQLFKISNYSTVSSAIERVKKGLKDEPILQKDASRLTKQITKSQQQT